MSIEMVFGMDNPVGEEQLTGISSAKALQSIPGDATRAKIQSEGATVRYSDVGTPTTTVGMKLVVDSDMYYNGRLASLKFIEVSATAKVNILYYA